MLGQSQRSGEPGGIAATDRARYFSVTFPTSAGGRSHSETWVGCIDSLTTPTRLLLTASRSVSSLSLIPKASNVLVTSYLRLKKRRSTNDCIPRLNGMNRPALARVETTTANSTTSEMLRCG